VAVVVGSNGDLKLSAHK